MNNNKELLLQLINKLESKELEIHLDRDKKAGKDLVILKDKISGEEITICELDIIFDDYYYEDWSYPTKRNQEFKEKFIKNIKK